MAAQNGESVWFRIELAEGGFIGVVGWGEDGQESDMFVARELGSLWLTAKEKVKELLEVDDKEDE